MSSTFKSVDPRTGEPGATFDEATPDDVSAAVSAAAAAFGDPALHDREKRAAGLRATAGALRHAGDEIVEVAMAESGLPEARLRGELERTAGQIDAFAGVVDEGDYVDAIVDLAKPDAKPLPLPDIRRMLVPIGPVAVFGASNFPLAFSTAGGDTASALAAGCPVVVKGHPSHPGTGELVARIVTESLSAVGLPDGTFAHLLASGIEVGEALVDEPAIAAVGFTGSYNGGRAIYDRAAARPAPIPVYAEMGSINPIVVTHAALAERSQAITDGLTASVANFGGQLCTKPGIVFVPADSKFPNGVAARLEEVESSVMLGERLRDALVESVDRLADHPAVEKLGGGGTPPGESGFRYRPAAFAADASALTGADANELLEEHFGPVVLFLRYTDRDDLLAALERLPGQLTGTIHAENDEDVADVAALLRARTGRVIFNGFPTGVAVTYAMNHGGPFPATTAPAHTSVGMTAIRRWLRPVAWQDAPDHVLPAELAADNPLGIWRRVNGELSQEPG